MAILTRGKGGGVPPYQSGCRVRLSSDQIVASDSWVKLLFSEEDYDIQGEFAANKFTAEKAGGYLVIVNCRVINLPDGTQVFSIIYKNGARYSQSVLQSSGVSREPQPAQADILELSVGDYIEGYIRHDSGVDQTADAQVFTNYMAIGKIS